MKNQQRGGILIEVLISLVIFALGIVGLLGSMAVSSQYSSENRFRTEAMTMADELFGQMAVSKASTLNTDYGPDSTNFNDWVKKRVQTLPNGTAAIVFPGNEAIAGGTFAQLTISWISPNAKPETPRGVYTTTTYFR